MKYLPEAIYLVAEVQQLAAEIISYLKHLTTEVLNQVAEIQ